MLPKMCQEPLINEYENNKKESGVQEKVNCLFKKVVIDRKWNWNEKEGYSQIERSGWVKASWWSATDEKMNESS